jgi:hypothetical protein
VSPEDEAVPSTPAAVVTVVEVSLSGAESTVESALAVTGPVELVVPGEPSDPTVAAAMPATSSAATRAAPMIEVLLSNMVTSWFVSLLRRSLSDRRLWPHQRVDKGM